MTYDNTLKYLVEQYPEDFLRYLLASEATNIQILKTELNQEPIRADSVTFLQTANQILHLEVSNLTSIDTTLTTADAGLLGAAISTIQLRYRAGSDFP